MYSKLYIFYKYSIVKSQECTATMLGCLLLLMVYNKPREFKFSLRKVRDCEPTWGFLSGSFIKSNAKYWWPISHKNWLKTIYPLLSLLMFDSPLMSGGGDWALEAGYHIVSPGRCDGCYHMRFPYLVWYSDLRQRRIIFILFKIFQTDWLTDWLTDWK